MQTYLTNVEAAIQDLRAGKMVILVDDPHRENEGDLIYPAEKVTPAIINFMVKHCSGIICMPMTEAKAQSLELPLMVPREKNTSQCGTPFALSIEAKRGVTTGVSAADRAHTIRTAAREEAMPQDLVRPGHVFPLIAREGGVLERAGHTEGSVDLMRLAGFTPQAVLGEVMNADGTMASGASLQAFAREHGIRLLAMEDLINYRLSQENLIAEETQAQLPLENYGTFDITVIKEKFTNTEHIILEKKITTLTDNRIEQKPVLVRIHSACATGDLFGSLRCDCHHQLHYSLTRLSDEGGLLIYLNQEGRGIGLFNKIKAYFLQEQGLDTVEANLKLGLPSDSRKYYIAANILRNKNIKRVRLLTNNPNKVNDLQRYYPHGLEISAIAMPVFCHEQNKHYLYTKQTKLNHLLHDMGLSA